MKNEELPSRLSSPKEEVGYIHRDTIYLKEHCASECWRIQSCLKPSLCSRAARMSHTANCQADKFYSGRKEGTIVK